MLLSTAPPAPELAILRPSDRVGATGELVERLRGDLTSRPPVDRELAGGLKEWLSDGLGALANSLDPDEGPLVVTRRMLATRGACPRRPSGPAEPNLVRAALIGTVFRQRLVAPCEGDVMAEAIAGLVVDGYSRHIVTGLSALPPGERRTLGEQIETISRRITGQWTPIPAGWLPRTRERLSVPVGGGRLVLTGVADLLLGRPGDQASVCVVSLRTTDRRPVDRSVRRLLALLETVRSGAQPFRVASYYPSTGELDVEEVTEEMLTGTVASLIERVADLDIDQKAA